MSQFVLYNVLTPVRLLSTTNVAGTYYNGPSNNGVGATLTVAASSLTIDSVVVVEGDRVLLQNQTSAYQNGIYIVKTISTTVVLQRAEDQQSLEQLKAGQFTIVGAGTVQQGSIYALVEPLPQTIGVDSFVFVASSVNTGGLTNTLTSAHLFVGNGSNVATDVAMSGDATMANTGALTIANLAVTAAKLAANAVTTAKILDANVTLAKLAAGITPSHVIKFANQVTTVGGAAAEAFTVTGAVAATDRAFVQVVDNGTANVSVLQAVVTANTLTVTFSGNPGADTIINYQLIRAAA
ncbi:MAG TPA: hypothetical protein ACFYDZ_00320 [Candidatus Brocadiaceae bacterium]